MPRSSRKPGKHNGGAHQGCGVRARLHFIVAHVSRICQQRFSKRQGTMALQKLQGGICDIGGSLPRAVIETRSTDQQIWMRMRRPRSLKQQQISTPAQLCCQWTELERADSRRWMGETLPASRTRYGKVRVGNSVIPSCPPCTLASNIGPPCACILRRHPRQLPAVAEQLVAALTNGAPESCFDATGDSRHSLLEVGVHAPGWRVSSATTLHAQGKTSWTTENQDPSVGGKLSLGRLWKNSKRWPRLTLQSPRPVPFPGRPTSQSPTKAGSTLSRSACLFFAASVSLFLPLCVPASGLPLDCCDHRATCLVAGVLGRRGSHKECAAARVCREPRARVSVNVRVQDTRTFGDGG